MKPPERGQKLSGGGLIGVMLAQGRELARGIMINYNLYRHYFPLQALGRARQHLRRKGQRAET
jgi:squalene-hopene/tetraprenyl-beta-curcumene cyclase